MSAESVSEGRDDRGRLDVAIVGGGPAGLATALAARRHGLSVAVFDRRHPPLDKPCGEGLMPDGLARLRELGVRLDAGRPIHGIRYVDECSSVVGEFPSGGADGAGRGVRRTELHAALVERAEAVGAALRWGVKVDGLLGGHGETGLRLASGERVPARFVVGADGLRSRVRRWAGLEASPRRRGGERFGVRRHFALEPWSHHVEVHWTTAAAGAVQGGVEAYVTPVADDEVGVAILWSRDVASGGFDTLLESFPDLADRLRGAEPTSRDRGCGPLHQRVLSPTAGRVALVGDASGYLDAITGEGLSLAFHQAHALGAALAGGDLRPYARRHRAIGRVPWALTALCLQLAARPRLRRRALAALAAEPALFERFLAVHVGQRSPGHLGPAAPRLLWRLATA